ncbi:MAG: alpha/beta hydrolase [Bacteroidales bacterium]|nr:alpha/beta hydrolase [Bacteroidales bacterium]
MKRIFTAFMLLLAGFAASAQNSLLSPDGTYVYEKRDTCDLFMDVYDPADGSEETFMGHRKPTIIFMFGGGFISGQRDNQSYNPWFRQFTENGYRVISIDYRLGLKGASKMGIAQVNLLDKAIHMAVEDLFSATNFILENAEQLGVERDNIVISGSSAGAITVMQAEYEVANRTSYASVLPQDFNYAGVMSFAGAILSRKGKVKYETAPCPTMMLHGTADKIVPYRQIALFNLGFYGGGKLVDRFKKFGYDYNMYHFIDYGHEIAGSMHTTFDLQLDFLEKNVIQGKKRIIEAWISDPDVWKGSQLKSLKDIYN